MYKEQLIELLNATDGDYVVIQGRVTDEYVSIEEVELLEDGSILLRP